jgi:peroxiredoxin
MGRNFSPSGSRVLRAKKSVTEVAPPRTMPSASSTLMSRAAFNSSCRACGTAASAARFMAVISSSTRFFWPSVDNSLAASSRPPGRGMRTFGLPRKPSLRPSRPTAATAPRSRALRTPATASSIASAEAGRCRPTMTSSAEPARVNCRLLMKTLPMVDERPSLARRRALQAGLVSLSSISTLATLSLGACGAREAAPDVEYVLLDGARVRTAAWRGRVVLVNFWATTCAVCVREMPQIVATHRKFHDRGFDTVAVAMRYDPPASVALYAESRRLPFGVAIDNTGVIARAYGEVQATPTSFLLDKRGAVARRIVGEPDFVALHRQIDELLAEA